MKPKIDQLNFGEVYGENEIKYLDDFKDFYYDINSAKSKILSKKKYVVIGRKGTGKTLLANVVCESLKDDYSISKVESLKEFVFHELSNFGGEDISSTKYVPLFEWMIHINIAKNITSNSQYYPVDRVEKLKKFLSYFGCISGELKPDKTIEMTLKSQGNVKGGIKLFDFGVSGEKLSEEVEKRTVRTYLENLENLKDYVLHTLLSSDGKVIIFYDELDDKFSNEDKYKHGIVSFLSAIEKTNNTFLDKKINAKICAVLRSDIINKLNSPNVNRIFEDNSIFLNWEASSSWDTELFDMLAHKVRRSSSYYSNKDTDAIFRDLMPSHIAHENFKLYILHRTLGRPRDIVRMLTFIQDEYGCNLDKFEASTFTSTSKKYSSYLKREISSELIGHVTDDELDNYFCFLTSFGKRGFTYTSAISKLSDDGFIKNEPDLRAMIKHLFRAGAICNLVRRSKNEGGDVYYWSYNDEDLTVNFDFNFEIHPGLWDVLKIPKPKNRLT